MSHRRIDDFVGDDLAYLCYLYGEVTKVVPVAELIPQLERQVQESRSVQPQGPSQPSIHLEDNEGQRQRQHESQAGNLRSAQPNHLDDTPSLQIEFWTPTAEDKPAQPSPAPGWWVSRTAKFFHNLPVNEEQWEKKRQSTQFSTVNEILRTVDCLVAGSLEPLSNNCSSAGRSDSPVAVGNQDSGDALSSSAERAAALIMTATNSQHIARFFSLVFMAECRVALLNGCKRASVYKAIQKFEEATGGNCNGDKTAPLRLSTTLWVLQEQQRQFRRGLLHRGFELFFNGGQNLYFYSNCPKGYDARFTSKFPTCEVPDEIHASLPLWLPFIVKLRNENLYSYTTICDALGVDLLSQEEDFRKWRDTYRSRNLVICRLQVDPSNSRPPTETQERRHRAKKRRRAARQTLQSHSTPSQGTRFRAKEAGQHSDPTVSRHDKSLAIRDLSALDRDAETGSHPSQGQQIAPGVDLAGDVSMRTVAPPHNSHTAPVDAATASTAASSDDTRLPSAPNSAVQEPFLIEAISSTTFFQPINAKPQRCGRPTTPGRPTQRPKEGAHAEGELCYNNTSGVGEASAARVTMLDRLSAAGQAATPAGRVELAQPSLFLRVSGSPARSDGQGGRLGGSGPNEELPNGPALDGILLRQAEDESRPQFCPSPLTASGFVPGIPAAPSTFLESPFGMLLEAVEQVVGLDEAAKGHSSHQSESWDYFMSQVMEFPEDSMDILT